MKENFNILHIASSKKWTGVADPATSMASYQQKMCNKVWFACTPGRDFELKARERSLHVLTSYQLDSKFNPLALVSDIRKLRTFIRDKRIDIVHCHISHDHWLCAFALRKVTHPHLLVRTFHQYLYPYDDAPHKWLYLKKTDLLVTLAQTHRQAFIRELGLDKKKVRVIYGGVDTDRFSPTVEEGSFRRSLNIPDNAPVAGIVSRLREDRGFQWLFKALEIALNKVKDARVIIVGRGEHKHVITSLISSSQFGDRIIMAGYRGDDLPNCYAAMDVCLQLAVGSDGSCRAALEAMATGRPVIAVRMGALRETVDEGLTGYLIGRNDTDGLASSLVRILEDRKAARDMGSRAREKVLASFTEEKRARDSLDAYQSVWRQKYTS